MKIAVCPGSFDPITKGHLDIIERACKLFDRIIILVAVNANKNYAFLPAERCALIQACTSHLAQVHVDTTSGLLTDYMHAVHASVIVKGLRAMSDFDVEFQQALANKQLSSVAETVFLTASAEHLFLSSSLVKQVATLGGNIDQFVPQEIAIQIASRLNQPIP